MTKRWLPVVLQGFALVLAVGLALWAPSPALAADGTGTMDVAGGQVVAASTGNTLTFTYTADSTGITAGSVEIAVPSGWTTPQAADPSFPGYVSTDALLANVTLDSDGSVTVSNLTLLPGQQLHITYSDATAPSVGGPATFTTSEANGSDTPAALVSSPSVQVLAADGSGTMLTSPSSVPAGSNQSLAFTYTADPGGIQDGTIDLVVPSGWTPPQISDSSSAGYVTAVLGASDPLGDNVGTLSIPSSGTIQLAGVTLAAGDTLVIGYGDATAPSAGTSTFLTDESSAGGTPAALAASAQVSVTPLVPGSPSLTSATPGDGQVTLSWTAPADGGSAIDHYVIDEFAGSSATGTPATITATSTSQTVSGLTNGTTYTFAVQAVNAVGPGQASDPKTATPATVPTAPNLIATVAGPKLVEVVWTPPSSTGGAAVSAYDVFRSTTAGLQGTQIATQAPTSSTNTYIDQAVTNGTTYYYEVVAENRAGQSAASGQFSAKPQTFLTSPLLLKTFTVSGHKVTFSSPNRCIRAGEVSGKLAVSATNSGRTKVKIGRAVFRVANLAKKTIARRKPSSAPIRVTLHTKHLVTRRIYTFAAQPSIVVGSHRPHRYTLRLKVTAC